MKIYVDADACPVKDVIIFEATNAEIPVTLVTSFLIILMQSSRKMWKQYMLIPEQMLLITELCS